MTHLPCDISLLLLNPSLIQCKLSPLSMYKTYQESPVELTTLVLKYPAQCSSACRVKEVISAKNMTNLFAISASTVCVNQCVLSV